MLLWQALGLPPDVRLGIIGGGGKTSALFTLGQEALALGYRPTLSTTTRMFFPHDQMTWLEPQVFPGRPQLKTPFFYHQEIAPDKIEGIQTEQIDILPSPLLYEADGSKRMPIKVHGKLEPVLAETTTHTLVVFGMSAWGRRLDASTVHRAELLEDLDGQILALPIAERLVARLLERAKGTPCLLLNQCSTSEHLEAARKVANRFSPMLRVAAREYDTVWSLVHRMGPKGEPDLQKNQAKDRRE